MRDQKPCRWHRRRPAQSICVTCLSPVCADCLFTTRVGIKCRKCAGGVSSGRWRRPAAVLGAIAAVCAAVAVVVAILLVRSPAPTQPAPAPAQLSAPTQPAGTPFPTGTPCTADHQMC